MRAYQKVCDELFHRLCTMGMSATAAEQAIVSLVQGLQKAAVDLYYLGNKDGHGEHAEEIQGDKNCNYRQ